MAIDTNSYQGEYEVPAAVEQEQQNSFQRELNDEEFGNQIPMPPEPVAEVQQEAPVKVEDPQERNFRALAESVEQLKASRENERRENQLQLEILRANQVQKPQEAQKRREMFDGMQDSEIPNVGEFRRAWAEREREYESRLEELQVQSQKSDYAEVLQKYGKQLAETDPLFVNTLKRVDNKAEYAYSRAKEYQEKQQLIQRNQELEAMVKAPPVTPQKSVSAQKMVENSRKPGTLAQAGGQGGLSQTDYYATMSDKDFHAIYSKFQEGI